MPQIPPPAALPSASLDHHETNREPSLRRKPPVTQPPTDRCLTFRHSGWQSRRLQTIAALEALGHHESRTLERSALAVSRLDRFLWCGAQAWVVRAKTDPDRIRLSASYCRDRYCQPCQATRANRIRTTLNDLLQPHRARLLTLTLRHQAQPLSDTVRRLYACFSALRRRPWWRAHVDAGVSVVEVKRNKLAQTWHVHVHAIVIGTYIPQRVLSREWLIATGDSLVVDVRAVWRRGNAVTYVLKYLTKQTDSATYNDHDALCEYIVAMHGRRMVTTFGAWRGTKLICDPDAEEWENICPLDQLIERAEAGEPAAVDLLARLTGREDLPVTEHPP